MYYDKQGKPISIEDYILLSRDSDYRIIGRDITEDGKLISTVWLGLDHAASDYLGSHVPIIFETMVFKNSVFRQEQYCERYSTLEAATNGHSRVLERLTGKQALRDNPVKYDKTNRWKAISKEL